MHTTVLNSRLSSGSFKIRGASNAVFSLTAEECSRGVVTHSSGNHAGAVALAAKLRGIPSHIVVPSNTPVVKTSAVKAYGGKLVEVPHIYLTASCLLTQVIIFFLSP